MKHGNLISSCWLLAGFMLLSGCMTCESISRGRRRVATSKGRCMLEQSRNGKYDAAAIKQKHARARELQDDFEVAFRDPDYLSPVKNPARDALAEHFLYYDEKVPTPEQFARLVDAIRQNPADLFVPLETVWISRHATMAQRAAMAKTIDALSKDRSPDSRGNYHSLYPRQCPWLLRYLLPVERMTEEDCRVVQNQVDPNGQVSAWLSDKIAEMEELWEREYDRADFYEKNKRR